VRFGGYVRTFGEYGVRTLSERASEAGVAGWDGLLIRDHLAWARRPAGTSPTRRSR